MAKLTTEQLKKYLVEMYVTGAWRDILPEDPSNPLYQNAKYWKRVRKYKVASYADWGRTNGFDPAHMDASFRLDLMLHHDGSVGDTPKDNTPYVIRDFVFAVDGLPEKVLEAAMESEEPLADTTVSIWTDAADETVAFVASTSD